MAGEGSLLVWMARIMIALLAGACVFGQAAVPRFRAEDVRPHGSAEPRPLTPGQLTWIFGDGLADAPGCSARNVMDPSTYQTELCGTRVLAGGIPAKLIAVMPGQINLVLPEHAWEDEKIDFQVIRRGRASAAVPVYVGVNRPVVSLEGEAFAGMPVWVRVDKPWGTGWLRYPYYTEPWDIGPASFAVRYQGRELPRLAGIPQAPPGVGMMIGLPHEVPDKYMHRIPLHLVFALDQPGTYEIRYSEYRFRPGSMERVLHQQSDWTSFTVQAATRAQREAWLRRLAAATPSDTVELMANYLPSVLAGRDEAALRLVARFLNSRDTLVRRYAQYGLHYFDAALLRRVLPGVEPLRGYVR